MTFIAYFGRFLTFFLNLTWCFATAPVPRLLPQNRPQWHPILSGFNQRKEVPQITPVSVLTTAAPADNRISCDGPELLFVPVVSLVLGLFYLTAGYRYLKLYLPASSLVLAGGSNLYILMQANILKMHANYIISILVGIVFAVITKHVICVGLISAGFTCGAIMGALATWIYSMLFTTPDISTSYMGVVTVILLAGIVGAVLSVYFPAVMAIPCTSITGSFIACISLDYLISRGSTSLWVLEAIKTNRVQALPCISSLIIPLLFPVYVVAGLFCQRIFCRNNGYLVPCKNACYLPPKPQFGLRTQKAGNLRISLLSSYY